MAATLRRIHQNLGHPPQRELVRRLRLGGASDNIIRAAEQLSCRTCEKSAKAKSAKVTHPAAALDFNKVVAVDVIWVDTIDETSLQALNMVDLASTYQVVALVKNTTSETLSQALISGWVSWAGAPTQLLIDLQVSRTSSSKCYPTGLSSCGARPAKHTGKMELQNDTEEPGRKFGTSLSRTMPFSALRWMKLWRPHRTPRTSCETAAAHQAFTTTEKLG